ncbi:MAG TPA: hypothetical protein EYP08_01470 [Pyrodictiaceae archaeon]|nr:hypothetical protein [Pyrodictiaceae archaeon]
MQRLGEELAKLVEREREKKPKLRLMKRDLRALVEAVKVAEEFKPSQHAKRVVFAKYGIIGSSRDQLLTAIFYDVMKRLGVIDKIVREVANVPSPLILDPWLRAALRVAVDLLVFHRLSRSSKHFLKWIVADFISSKTHPYVGMYYWQVLHRLRLSGSGTRQESRPRGYSCRLSICGGRGAGLRETRPAVVSHCHRSHDGSGVIRRLPSGGSVRTRPPACQARHRLLPTRECRRRTGAAGAMCFQCASRRKGQAPVGADLLGVGRVALP